VVSVVSWCRACGATAEEESSPCARCGAPFDQPDPGPARVGLVAVAGWRRARHLGVVVHESARSVHLLVAGRGTAEMPLGAFDAAAVAVPGPAVTSAAGRLWKALAAQSTANFAVGGLAPRWQADAVASVAFRLATTSVGARRAAARDALALGTPQVIGALGLPMLESCWYQAWAAAAAADTPGLVGWLERLPPAGYPARAGLLMARAADLIRDRALGARAAVQLAPFTTADPGVRALHAVLAGEPADTIAVLGEYLGPGGNAAALADQVAGELGDLRAAVDMVFGSRWDAALAAGKDLARRAGQPAIRAEALNIAAFCQGKLGDLAAALGTLGTALDGAPAVPASEIGLLVNASVIAAATGSPAAIPYLARIAGSGADPEVRSAACQRAIDLWMGDAEAQEYPGPLRAMVRDALAARQEDEFHWRLLRLADLADTTWLALEARLRSANENQAGAERYWRTWARAKTDGGQEDLSDVAATLGELAGRPAPPAWVCAELRAFAQQLNEGVHVEFGAAVHLAPAIEALLDAGVLDLDQRLVLAAQAGAHIAAAAGGQDGVIAPECERRLLLEVAAEYGGRRAELAGNYVGGELARCLTVAARAVALAAQSEWETGTKEWNELVNLPSGSRDPGAVRRAKLRILDALQLWVTRLRDYRAALDGLPRIEAGGDITGALAGLTDEWSAEISRLRQLA
jgi:tetratricopeptide (TPR) repeat protein